MKSLLLILAALTAMPTWAAGCDGLQISDAWVRTAPPGATVMAGYATVKNVGTQKRTIRDVSSKDFAAIETHKTLLEGGVSKMLLVETIDVAPKSEARFEPGGMHLMLFEPKRSLKAGDTLQLSFSCGGKKRLKAKFLVKDAP
ncbi:MAG: copper chaperone PCu(A)C [Pseudomonadota bacterium]